MNDDGHGDRGAVTGNTAASAPWSPADQRALRAIATQFFINGMVFASFLPRLPELRARTDLTTAGLGLVLTVSALGGLLASLISATVFARTTTRRVMVLGTLGVVAMLPLVGAAQHWVLLLVALAALQLGDGLVDVAMNMQGSRLNALRATPVMNRLHGLWSLGSVVGGIIATLAASRVSLTWQLCLVSLALLGCLARLAPDLPTSDAGLRPTDGPADSAPGAATTSGRAVAVTAAFVALGALAFLVESTPGDWAAIRLRDDLNVGEGSAGAGFVAVTLGMLIGRFSGDAAEVRVGRNLVQRIASPTALIGVTVATLTSSTPVTLIGLFLAGLGTSVVFPMLYDRAARAPGRSGAAVGALTAGIRVGLLAGPVAIGTLAATDALSTGQAMGVVAIPAALTIALWAWSPR